ncbi:MAG TPA: hypothetical protein PKO22_06620 [Treponemataceae bacterium]|nr:hypothetical protein [Treponemataceae bacterium]
MMITDDEQYLSRIFNPANRETVLAESFEIAASRLNPAESRQLTDTWRLTTDLYKGAFPGYVACNTEYHDFNHTCDVVCATIRMCDGALSQGIAITPKGQIDLYLAAMLHDAGYIQEVSDTVGTGAKYTKTHVARSVAFTLRHRAAFGLDKARADGIGRMIAGTDLATPFNTIPFKNKEELYAAKLLASADLLGQMADRTYLEKLLFLYYEFKEADFPGYNTEFDMLRKTLGFYEMTKERLFNLLGETSNLAYYHFLARYGVAKNLYLESIERQIEYLRTIIDDDTVNFRKKLKRIDLEAVSRKHGEIA